jgi:hypothetical protein
MAVNTPVTAVCNSLSQMLLQDVFILDISIASDHLNMLETEDV